MLRDDHSGDRLEIVAKLRRSPFGRIKEVGHGGGLTCSDLHNENTAGLENLTLIAN